ncbi:hypothetical protein HYZ98_02095 [Candidatus Peregrinibacteria bacterium]|nr:hypothetical protein [Candidatus Peregrinibacteria bacterium]
MNNATKLALFAVGVSLLSLIFVLWVNQEISQLKPQASPQEPTRQETQTSEGPNVVELPENLRHLSALTVQVKTPFGEGSGLLVKSGDTPYCWTAGYLVEHLYYEEKEAGRKWNSASIIIPKGDGFCLIPADVIRYSDPLAPALLRLRESLPLPVSTVFAESTPAVDTQVYHVGCFPPSSPSFTTKGTVTTIGEVYGGHTYDAVSQMGLSGSGGGGVFTKDGTCLGMMMLGRNAGDLILPAREIRQWAKDKNVLWALDSTAPMPSEEELKTIPIEG